MSILASMLVSLALGPAPFEAACPADDPRVRTFVTHYLSHPRFGESRAAAGLAAGQAPARLTDANDAATCERLNQMTRPGGAIGPSSIGPYSYFRVGNRYLVVAAPPENVLGWTGVHVLDASFTLVESVAI